MGTLSKPNLPSLYSYNFVDEMLQTPTIETVKNSVFGPDYIIDPPLFRRGQSGPEIADQTGLSPGSVRVNLHRGMKLLRERLGLATQEVADAG